MKILQRYIAVSIAQAVAFVLVALLGLAAFMDLTHELPMVGKNGYMIQHAFLYVLLRVPGHVYEVMPVAALIGTIFTMAQFASTSEFTIMRASSMSTAHAAWMLFKIGTVFVAVTFLFGELVAPRTSPLAEKLKLSARGAAMSDVFKSGMWTKDTVHGDGLKGPVTGSRFFNVRKITGTGELLDLKLYEFDTSFRMRSLITAKRATFAGDSTWQLEDVSETVFANTGPPTATATPPSDALAARATYGQENSVVSTRQLPTLRLVSEITPRLLLVSASDPGDMSANELALYTRHLSENKQETERFKIAFWKKLFDPLAIFVLMALALPFAYLHTRSGGVSLKIFIGIMIGVAFILVNTLFAHIGLLSTAVPAVVTAIAPSLLFLGLAIGALWWVERH